MSRFGELAVKDDLVVDFREKPQIEEGWINGGFFVFQKEFLDYLDEDSMLERTPLEQAAQEKQLAIYKHDGFWQSMNTMKDNLVLEDLWTRGAPWKVW